MSDSLPGHRAIKESEESAIFAAGPDNQHCRLDAKVNIASTTTDAANSPTTTLRGGLLMGLKDSDSKGYAYAADANDGTQKIVGVLANHLDMKDRDGTVEDKFRRVAIGGIFKNINDLVGINKQAAGVLFRRGFRNAAMEPHGSMFGLYFKARYFKAADYTLVDADHGCSFVATAAVNFTLPSLATVGAGYQVFLFNAANTTMVITGAADTIVYDDTTNGLATTLTFSTGSNKMGAAALMVSDYVAASGALRWFPMMLQRTVTAA